MTSSKFSDFLTPTPCPHLDLIYTMRFTQPPLLRQLFHDLPFPLGCVHLIWMHPKDDSRGRGDLDDSEVIHWRCQNNLYPFWSLFYFYLIGVWEERLSPFNSFLQLHLPFLFLSILPSCAQKFFAYYHWRTDHINLRRQPEREWKVTRLPHRSIDRWVTVSDMNGSFNAYAQ